MGDVLFLVWAVVGIVGSWAALASMERWTNVSGVDWILLSIVGAACGPFIIFPLVRELREAPKLIKLYRK